MKKEVIGYLFSVKEVCAKFCAEKFKRQHGTYNVKWGMANFFNELDHGKIYHQF